MSAVQIEIQLIAAVVAVACALPGVYLVLRRMALLSDAISHAILLGIVLGFFLVEDIASPVLVITAAATGVLTAVLVELVHRTGLLKEDAAIGLVFPVLFSLGVILISRHAGNVHLDTDAVLLGELAFSPFRRLEVGGVDLGPKTLHVMLAILFVELVLLGLFHKEMKLATFDPALAATLGFSPVVLHYGFMSVVSVTAVGAFDAVGAILVVALMIAPPSAAYLLVQGVGAMLVWSAAIGAVSAVSGYWLAHLLDASIAGSMATMAGVTFLLAYLFAPDRGLVSVLTRRKAQKMTFARTMLAMHLFQHEGLAEEEEECRIDHLSEHLRWPRPFATRVVESAERRGLVVASADAVLRLTPDGRTLAREAAIR